MISCLIGNGSETERVMESPELNSDDLLKAWAARLRAERGAAARPGATREEKAEARISARAYHDCVRDLAKKDREDAARATYRARVSAERKAAGCAGRTPDQKAAARRAREQLPANKAKNKAYMAARYADPEIKAKAKAATKAWYAANKEKAKARRQRPEVKAKAKARRELPEVKAKAKAAMQEYMQQPEVKAKARAYMKAWRAANKERKRAE